MLSPELRGTLRAAGIVSVTLALLAAFGAVSLLHPPARASVVRTWHRIVCRLAGISVRVHGAPLAPPGSLLVANHVSYMDVLAIGSLGDISFVAKGEVAGWPLIGNLASLVGTIFATRERGQACRQIDEIGARLAAGRTVAFFPEGTTTRGRTVLPFKSALFEAAKGCEHLLVQPIAITYAWDTAGLAPPVCHQPVYPWTGQATLLPHLWMLLKHRGGAADVVIGEPVTAARFGSRKALAAYCHTECAHALARARQRPLLAADEKPWLPLPVYRTLG
jgi:lyso-ornithine lipid O-acyltransferase